MCDAPREASPETAAGIDALVALDPDALDDAELEAAVCEFARARARLDAAEAAVIGELDQRACYLDDGALTARAWLVHHTGAAPAVAGGRVLLAKRLRRMPVIAAALSEGAITEAHARSAGRCLTPRTLEAFARDEELLAGHARQFDADSFDKLITRWLQVNDEDGPGPGGGDPSELRASRMMGGRTKVDGDLDVEDSAEIVAELELLHELLWREDRAADDGDPLKGRSRAQRMAAAWVEMARRSSTTHGKDDDGPTPRRPQLIAVVNLDPATGELGEGELDDGTPLPAEVLERWACDCSIGRVVMAGRSIPVDLGKLTYSPSPGQRRALMARDRGCIVPGCDRKARWTHAHHVVPFPHGPTNLNNLVLLCTRHHKQVHNRVLKLERHGDHWQVQRADGTPLRERPPPRLVA
jgi:hypothetical protein